MKEELTKEEILQAFFTITKEELELAVGIINTSRRLGLTDTVTKKILPRPVIRDGNGKLIKNHTPRDFFLKLQEEIFEVIDDLNCAARWEDSENGFIRSDREFMARQNYDRAGGGRNCRYYHGLYFVFKRQWL